MFMFIFPLTVLCCNSWNGRTVQFKEIIHQIILSPSPWYCVLCSCCLSSFFGICNWRIASKNRIVETELLFISLQLHIQNRVLVWQLTLYWWSTREALNTRGPELLSSVLGSKPQPSGMLPVSWVCLIVERNVLHCFHPEVNYLFLDIALLELTSDFGSHCCYEES